MRHVPRLSLLSLVAFALVVSGCGSDDATQPLSSVPVHRHHRADGDAQNPQRTATPKPASPTAEATDSSPAAKAHAPRPRRRVANPRPAARRTPLEAHLLAAEQVPGLVRRADGGSGWTVGSTGPEAAVSVGACQQTGLETIGAVSAVRRTYLPADDVRGRATQVVAQFADRKSAWRAHQVLRSWHEECEAEAGPLRSVDVSAGAGENYRTRVTAPEARRAQVAAFGIVARGSYLCVIEIRALRRDFPTDRAPARVAVRRIARSFT